MRGHEYFREAVLHKIGSALVLYATGQLGSQRKVLLFTEKQQAATGEGEGNLIHFHPVRYNEEEIASMKENGNQLVSVLNNPVRIQFTNGNVTRYVYGAASEKLRTTHLTAVPNISVSVGHIREGLFIEPKDNCVHDLQGR